MGAAIDTIGVTRTAGGGADAAFTAMTAVAGDSLTIRNIQQPGRAYLEGFTTQAIAGSAFRVRSPLMHDLSEGIQVFQGETPSSGPLGDYLSQDFDSQDTLIAEAIINAGAGVGVAALRVAYDDIPGIAARLHRLSEIASLIDNIKVLRVTMGAGGAAGAWLETALTVTENVLRANTDYAVLGYITDVALAAVGIRGADTGNLRIAGIGSVRAELTRDHFIRQSEMRGKPRIPVFNSANAGATFAVALGNASPTGANVQLICAQLTHQV